MKIDDKSYMLEKCIFRNGLIGYVLSEYKGIHFDKFIYTTYNESEMKIYLNLYGLNIEDFKQVDDKQYDDTQYDLHRVITYKTDYIN